jgi:hypothetical protein
VLQPNAVFLVASLLLAPIGCDSGGGADSKADAKLDAKAQEEAELQKRLEERRKKREEEQKAKEEAAAKKEAQLDAVAIVPEGAKLPKDLAKACDEVGKAQMAFFERNYEGETLEKLKASSGTAIPMTVGTCKKSGSIEAAVCQVHALNTAPPEMKEDLSLLLRKCLDKFGKNPGSSAVPPQ